MHDREKEKEMHSLNSFSTMAFLVTFLNHLPIATFFFQNSGYILTVFVEEGFHAPLKVTKELQLYDHSIK